MARPRVRRKRIRRTIPILLALLSPFAVAVAPVTRVAAASPAATPDLGTALQARLEGIRVKYAIPGISVAINFPDGTTWVGTAGVADVATRTPVTPDTAFAVASISKTFTAALVLALAQEGKLGLDVPADAYLPDLDLNPAITVRQLLDHTSGLRDFFFGRGVDAALLAAPERRWDAATSLGYVGKPYFKPGRGWHYSNTNYLILGILAERVGRAPLADQLRDRFIEPLGLEHTYYQPAGPPRGPVAHGYRFKSSAKDVAPVDLSDGTTIVPFTSVVTAAAGAGGVASTASDLARWARALYDGTALREATVGAMVDDITRTERYRPRLPYGLGVQAVDVIGHASLGHSGRLLGFRSVVRWLPDDGLAIAVLTNQSRTDPAIVVRALLRIAFACDRICAAADRR
jgi:D-alanyl-D-alanine carboxypeptidase